VESNFQVSFRLVWRSTLLALMLVGSCIDGRPFDWHFLFSFPDRWENLPCKNRGLSEERMRLRRRKRLIENSYMSTMNVILSLLLLIDIKTVCKRTVRDGTT
jgi:hypothetical protein